MKIGEGERLTAGQGSGRRRGPAAREFHVKVLPAVLDSDGVHDGVQEIAARKMACL
jgi:hypothetical protein